MSYENALKTVDFLLDVLNEADKPAPVEAGASATKETKPKTTTKAEDVKEEYFASVEDDGVEEGKTVKVTLVSKRLEDMWQEAELGINDDKDMYLGAIGKVMELEEDDDTVQLRWANLDTCWIPIKACVVKYLFQLLVFVAIMRLLINHKKFLIVLLIADNVK